MPGVELFWLGQAGFRLRDLASGAVVFCDPFLAAHQDRTWQAPVGADALAHADVILVSHEHLDHFDRPSLQAAANQPGARFTLVIPRPLLPVVQALDLPPGRLIGAQPDEPIELGSIQVYPVPARHGIDVADAYSFGQELSGGLTRYLGYVVEIGGARVYHAGDGIPYPGQAARIKALRPHLALLPINGRDFFRETERNIVGNMDLREAARLASDIGVEVLVPMHWELFANNRGYPGNLVDHVAAEHGALSVLVMGRGAHHIFTPAAD